MNPVSRIKSYIAALNAVSYDDKAQLESFIAHVREDIRTTFGSRSFYITYLNTIVFLPVLPLASPEENVRFWAKAKKQLLGLLHAILEDPLLQSRGAWEDLVSVVNAELKQTVASGMVHERGRSSEINSSIHEVVRAFKYRVRLDLDMDEAGTESVPTDVPIGHIVPTDRPLPRIRIDLRDLYLFNDGVEDCLAHPDSVRPKINQKKVLFISRKNIDAGIRVGKFLNLSEATVVPFQSSSGNDRNVQEYFSDQSFVQMAVVFLSEDCWVYAKDSGQDRAVTCPSPLVSFQLGYLVGRLGRNRVVVLYEETEKFRRPTGYFDAVYIPVTPSGSWRRELGIRLKENNIAVKSEAHPFFYRD